MKLSARTVLFNFLLELDAHDVDVLQQTVEYTRFNAEALTAVTQRLKVSPSDALNKLAESLATAQSQITATREVFATGERSRQQTPMRGIAVRVVDGAHEVPLP